MATAANGHARKNVLDFQVGQGERHCRERPHRDVRAGLVVAAGIAQTTSPLERWKCRNAGATICLRRDKRLINKKTAPVRERSFVFRRSRAANPKAADADGGWGRADAHTPVPDVPSVPASAPRSRLGHCRCGLWNCGRDNTCWKIVNTGTGPV